MSRSHSSYRLLQSIAINATTNSATNVVTDSIDTDHTGSHDRKWCGIEIKIKSMIFDEHLWLRI